MDTWIDFAPEPLMLFYPVSMPAAFFLLLVSSLTAGQTPSTADPSALLHAGEEAQKQGDHRLAIKTFQGALALHPDMLRAHTALVFSQMALGELDASIDEDRRALAASPDDESVRINLALLMQKKGDTRAARSELESVRAAHPQDFAPAVFLANVEIQIDRNEDAIALLEPLEHGHEGDPDLEYPLAFAQIESRHVEEGLPRMEKLAKATQSANAWLIAGATHLHRNEFTEARADLDAAMELNANLPGVATMAGQARFALGDSDGAVPAFRAALRTDPRDFTANLYLGIMAIRNRDLEGARALLELALELRPDFPLARLEMAKLNSMTGKDEEAVKTLEDLARATPDWPDPHIQLATLYFKLHRPDDGKREREIVQRLEAKQQKQGPSNN